MEKQVYHNKISILRQQLHKELPGTRTQFLMAPETRRPPGSNNNSKKAAVLILLFPQKSDIGVVFIKREIYDGAHSGQVSFPGGIFEKEDIDLKTTALRETSEETGVNQSEIKIIGKLSQLLIPVSNFMVYPYVGYVDKKPDFRPDPTEVEYLIFSSLSDISDPENIKKEKWNLLGNEVLVPFYFLSGEKIWGATAMILSEFIETISRSGLNQYDH